MFKIILLVLSAVCCCYGQIRQDGQCDPDISLMENFDIITILGRWYEIARTENPHQNGDCSVVTFGRHPDEEDIITVNNEAVNDNFFEKVNGTGIQYDNTAKLELDLSISSNPVDFWIIRTDGSNFAIGYKCRNIGVTQREVFVWLLGRQVSYNGMTLALINVTLNNTLGITSDDLQFVDHSEDACYILPEIEEGEPILLPGSCDPNITAIPNFDLSKFSGVWHEIASYETENVSGTCLRTEYNTTGNVISVHNNFVVNQTLEFISGSATLSVDGSAELSVILINDDVYIEQNLWIIATDYESYALSYFCEELPNDQKRVYSWIHSRTRQLPESSQLIVNEVIDSVIDLNQRYYQETKRSDQDCFYYPDPVPDRPVIFRGACDLNIPVVSNFNLQDYLGLWHVIESYPSVHETGTCNNAQYSSGNDTSLSIYNTQVINQTLDSIDGIGTLDSVDGSAKMIVSFLNENVNATINYWVLATDYDSYALVYSCQNIDDDREVFSWKLSRTKSLTSAAETAITNTISSIPVLDQRYYQASDQSPEGCFYFPEPESGVTVVFPGQCDESIPVVDNFNLTQFQGLWHEIESYPTEELPGQCVRHSYTEGADATWTVLASQVIDESLVLSNGTVVFTAAIGAKLTIEITINDTEYTIPYWIVDTDYVNYALAYSCININSDYRKIWSWKLSRTLELSTASESAIANIISSIDVLDERYYDTISQTDESCFYLPDLGPHDPVIIIGQCDEAITVVEDFDSNRFAGRWFDIESYYEPSQTGTCNDATFNLDGNTFEIENTQVIDEELDIISTQATLASDGSAKLIFTSTVNGSTLSTEYWILDTDYDSYALVYSCQNVDSENRHVRSWKLSRTRNLSNYSSEAIDNIVNSINVLNYRFYQTKDHSEQACFYYPERDPSQPVVFRGQCDESISAVQNFDLERYLGLWYVIESYPSVHETGTCNNAQYSDGNETSLSIYNTQVINQTLDSIDGVGTLDSEDGSAKMIVSFLNENVNATINYWVLATDYNSYALVYSCQNIDDYRGVFSWKLSRTKSLTSAAETAITNTISSIQVLDQRYYQASDQSPEGCFYFPEPESGVTVVFPGQCDESIPVVDNFNLTQFQGLWHEIESYPTEELPGQCVRHSYTEGADATWTVLASQVIDKSLVLSNGTVVFSAAIDAKLTVEITINDTEYTIPYWIVDTDYVNYALAYSCININSDYRKIWSWKLSRTLELSTASESAIANIISSIDVLDECYYDTISQTDESCFYLPDLGPHDPVIIIGQCDEAITVVEDFDSNRFAGRWFDIESYYEPSQTGTCNDATFNLDGNTFEIENTQVIDEELDIISTQATLASDGSAKLIFTSTVNGSTLSTEYWILDTDYDSYALVYSCQNVDSENRHVRSWKLSRTRNLSNNSSEAIDNIVNSINVLNDRFYQTKDHSEQACFYYPERDPSQPVVFRGQCDESISAVQNFDLERYLGLWYVIESYPSVHETGTCNNAQYSDGNETSLSIYNTQVINQTLDSIDGVGTLDSEDGSAKMIVSFLNENVNATINYWVLATDYNSYALVYSCQNIDDYRGVFSWKLSRTKSLTSAAETAITNTISSIQVLDQRYYQASDQSPEGCFYFPEPESGVTVVFPGQCNESIPVVDNFNLTQFQGLWHEIESYPTEELPGQCVRHSYTEGADATWTVLASQVIDESLVLSNGTVVFSAAIDAKLTIEITINDTEYTIPYWIVDTDYVNYALAYSCININSDYRKIWSWKLSRTLELSTASESAIANIISSIDVLDERYYETISQTDESCFFLPDLGPNDPVIIIGQCDEDITVVEDFNSNRFAGRWFDIESYYEPSQTGTCNDATFNLDGNTFEIENTQVIDEELDIISTQATLASDGSAKLIFTSTVNGSTLSTEYWILDTDYDSYALVYSCQNVDSENRHVRSWKLSRTRNLSNNSSEAIDNIVNSINVLNDRFYQTKDHSEQACFYYPERDPNQTVVFRGQCDESISAVQNFDLERYADKWYDIESYPQDIENGTCSTAEYDINDDALYVYNTQVVNLQLASYNGTARRAAGDTSAKFILNFPNETIPYWVLATDYDNYALVYSCVNLNDEYYRVASWKLSRRKSLSEDSLTAINNAMNNIKVLRQQYFELNGHSEDDCFYYPYNYGGPVIQRGLCDSEDQINVIENFNVDAFTGIWHEAARFPSELQTGECVANEYVNINSQDNSFSIEQTIVNDEKLTTIAGAGIVSNDGRGIIRASFINNAGNITTMNIYILDIEYDEFALLYSCRNVGEDSKQIYSWKLSRSRSGLSDSVNERIDEIVWKTRDLFDPYYENTDQSYDACFYYPVFDETPPFIELPGPCDERIQAKPNFNTNAYLGRWIEISKYPIPLQVGECARAHYNSGSGDIEVVNTIVYNGTLESSVGSATIVSTDNSGLLNVSFIVDGEIYVANYYVLETDYDNFAIAYSCRDLDNGNRQVSSWKLSRERTLSEQSNNAINNVIATTRGLLEDYYTSTSQSDEDCFYVPELNVNQGVVFRGQCEEISGVEEFDVQRYLGWWHEIEHYPSDGPVGECISSRYETSGNDYQVVETNIYGVTAIVNTSSLQVTSDGKLTKTLSNGETVEMWVLATDYDNYAFLYSCKNIDPEHRRVWSAKHSKTRQLSEAAQNAMTPIIENNQVLYPQFYLPINQSDDACFHYPEQTGEVIILPGQCNMNIPVVQNFQLSHYTGTWYEIERYPTSGENGTCVGTRYNLDEQSNDLDVINWYSNEDGVLKTIEGRVISESNDGRLTVILSVPDSNVTLTTQIYVLATDYASYSVTYTCTNVDEYHRAVGAWKLSRTRSLPNNTNSAINALINEIEELHQPYFIQVHHDDTCEDPNGALILNSSIIILLLCVIIQLLI